MGKSTEQNGMEEGVSVPVNPNENGGRDALGRFTRGNPGGPGRPTKADEVAMLGAIRATMPPERITATLVDVLEMAEESNSWRAKMAVIEFCANYVLGKPVQRVVQESNNLHAVLTDLGIDISE